MRKVMMITLALCAILTKPCLAADLDGEDLLSLATLKTAEVTPAKITSLLGKPARIEESKRKSWWYYSKGKANMVVCWNRKSETLEKMSFTAEEGAQATLDNKVQYRLKSGVTDISQALKMLGVPKDMTIKETTQEIHYAYQNSVLRLFFRDHTLVDFCLY